MDGEAPAGAAGGLRRRGLALVPLAGCVLVVLVFYLVEASLRTTPWDFTDELEWSQLSRAIAATGHAARRGEPVYFKSLYAYLIAPAWWIHSTSAAYAAIKDLNAVVMCLAALPAYLLARSLVSGRAAAAVAFGTVAIPAMSYATSIIPESLAYTWFALTAWLTLRALVAPRPASIALAAAASALGPLVRKEFVVLPAAALLAAAALWVLAGLEPGSLRASTRRLLVAAAGLALFGFLFNWLVVERIQPWTPGQYLNSDTFTGGALALGGLSIGLGVLPLIGAVASLRLPERSGQRAYRAFVVYLAAATLTLVVYTGAKVTYLAGSQPLIEERNLFFLSPLLLCGTALALSAGRLDWRLVAAGAALALAVSWSGRFEVGAPYFEAPGLAIVTLMNRELYWDAHDMRLALLAVSAVSLGLLVLRRRRGVPLLAALLCGAWLLTGEIYATRTDMDEAAVFAAKLPAPRGWVDAASHGAPVTFLGQAISDADPLWLTEFWNRSLRHVDALDGTAPGPGPASAPKLVAPDGTLGGYTGDPYTLAGDGVVLAAPLVASRDRMSLYSTPHGWRLRDAEAGVYPDGSMESFGQYTFFVPGGPGVLSVHLSRTGFNGSGPAGQAILRVGTVRLGPQGVPVIGRLIALRRATVRDGKVVSVSVAVARTPVTVVIWIRSGLITNDPTDPRPLGAQLGFSFRRGSPRR